MRVLSILFFVLAVNISSVFCENNYGSLMYEITSPNISDTSYIFGTMHMVSKDEFFIWEVVVEKVKKCKKIALEADMSLDMESRMKLMKNMRLPGDSSLEDFIDTDKLNEFKSYVHKNVDIPEKEGELIWKLKPFYALSMILNYYVIDPASYDIYFSEMAEKSQKEVISLETMEFQMELINNISIQEQFDLFINTNIFEEFDKTYEAYSKMDLHLLEKMIREDKSYAQVEEWLVVKRNYKWMETIAPIIKNSSVFIAVGAGHLIGEDGLLKLLEKNGYTIKAVPLTINEI